MNYKERLKEIKKRLIEIEKRSVPINVPKIIDIYDSSYDMDSCLCTDSKNRFKKLYISEHEAEKVAKFLFDEQGIYLMVYPCPYSSGWHLSRR